MSCGRPGDADCSEVLDEVWLFLDNECDQERRTLLKRHLDECGSCLEKYGLEEHLKALLARKCGGDHAPDEFKQRLRKSITEIMLRQAVLGAEVSVAEVTTAEVTTVEEYEEYTDEQGDQDEDADGPVGAVVEVRSIELRTTVESHAWTSREP